MVLLVGVDVELSGELSVDEDVGASASDDGERPLLVVDGADADPVAASVADSAGDV